MEIHRRKFLHLAASAAVLPSFSYAYGAPRHKPDRSRSKPQLTASKPIAPKDVTITTSSEFMQDYITAQPVLETQGLEETYVARDGTLNIYSPVGFDQPQAKPSIDRLHGAGGSTTGWAIERHTLLSDDPDAPPALANSPPDLFPTIVIAPSERANKNNLLIFRQYSIHSIGLGADGSFDRTTSVTSKNLSIPMLHGRLADDTRYLPELEVDLAGNVKGVILRDVLSMDTYPVDMAAIPVSKGWASGARRAIFPARDSGEAFYRFVALEETGDVTANLLRLDSKKKTFVLRKRQVIGRSASGSVAVREAKLGQVEVFIADLPSLQVISGVYKRTDSVGTWKAPATAKLTNPPAAGANGPARFNIAMAPGTGVAQLMLIPDPQPSAAAPAPAGPAPAPASGSPAANPAPVPAPAPSPAAVTCQNNIGFVDRSGYWTCHQGSTGAWLAARRPGRAQFEPMVQLDPTIRFVSFFPDTSGNFLAWRPGSGFEVWRSGDSGQLQTEAIRVEGQDAQPKDGASYRVGVTLNLGAQPLGGQAFTIKASAPTVALIGGRYAVIAPDRAAAAKTDTTGSLWATVMVAGLGLPRLVLGCPLFAQDVVVDLGEGIRTQLANLTADQLKDAVDPLTKKKVLPKPEHAEVVAAAITQLMKQVPSSEARPVAPRLRAAPGRSPDRDQAPAFVAHAKVAARLVPRAEATEALAPIPVEAGSSWRLVQSGAELKFELIDPGTAVEHHERMLRDAPLLGSWWNPVDDFNQAKDQARRLAEEAAEQARRAAEEAAEQARRAAEEAAEQARRAAERAANHVEDFVVNNGTAALTVVIDGVKYTYSFAIDHVSDVLHGVEWVLDQAGVELGTMVGWLLKQLGFLFDWSAFLHKRDELREIIRERAGRVTTTMPDPGAAFASARAKLDEIQSSTVSYLTALRKEPASQRSFGDLFNLLHGPTLPSFLESPGGISLLPQVTYLVDKVMSAVPIALFDLGTPDIPGFATLGDDFDRALAPLDDSIQDFREQFADLAERMVSNASSFSASAFDPVLEVLIGQIDTLFAAIETVVDVIGSALHQLWASPEKVIDWLDTEIEVPFFSGFYRGLTDAGRFSIFDLCCLMAAIPAVLIGGDAPSAAAPRAAGVNSTQAPLNAPAPLIPLAVGAASPPPGNGPPPSNLASLHSAGFALRIMGCFFNTIDAGITAGTKGGGDFGTFIAVMNAVCTLGGALCDVWENDSKTNAEVISGLTGGLVGLVLLALAKKETRANRLDALAWLNVLGQAIWLYFQGNVMGTIHADPNVFVMQAISTVQALNECHGAGKKAAARPSGDRLHGCARRTQRHAHIYLA
jgi:hypothetical protein